MSEPRSDDHHDDQEDHRAAPPAFLGKHNADIFTRLAVDPIAIPFARRLARLPGVTPNRITVLAGLLAVAATVAFADGRLRLGGALFVLRFYVDCLDGTVARVQGTSSRKGAALDLVVDVTGISICSAALCWALVRDGHVPPGIALFLLAAIVVYNFLLAYRKQLADRLGEGGDGGGRAQLRMDLPVLRSWAGLARRLDMNPVPYSVEAEILSFGIVPLVASPDLAGDALWATLAFYALAALVNMGRVWRIAGRLDAQEVARHRT